MWKWTSRKPTEVPLIAAVGRHVDRRRPGPGPAELEQMTEEELLRGLEGLPPAESPGSQRNGY
jgi:DNA-directed RNA polymerase subunit omega